MSDEGGLPNDLEQAAAYVVTNRVPFTNNLNSYRKQRLKRLEKAKPDLGLPPLDGELPREFGKVGRWGIGTGCLLRLTDSP